MGEQPHPSLPAADVGIAFGEAIASEPGAEGLGGAVIRDEFGGDLEGVKGFEGLRVRLGLP